MLGSHPGIDILDMGPVVDMLMKSLDPGHHDTFFAVWQIQDL